MRFIGIDPGDTGAIAWFDGRRLADWRKMPKTIEGKVAMLREVCRAYNNDSLHIVLEHVTSMPGQGVASTFKFGRGFGQLEGIMSGLGLEYELARPIVWQGATGGYSGGDKKQLAARVNAMFPRFEGKIPQYAADAVLIALFAKQRASEVSCE